MRQNFGGIGPNSTKGISFGGIGGGGTAGQSKLSLYTKLVTQLFPLRLGKSKSKKRFAGTLYGQQQYIFVLFYIWTIIIGNNPK